MISMCLVCCLQCLGKPVRGKSRILSGKWDAETPKGLRGVCVHLRMLIHELRDVVDLIVNHAVEILLGVVLGNVLVSEFLEGHLD